LTVSRAWPFDYHTAFHICGLMMLLAAVLSLKLPHLEEDLQPIPNASEES